MRRFIRLSTALASLVGVVTLASPVARAAAGDVTTTNVTPPAAITGLTSTAVTAARDGGMYFVYASGDNYKVFKAKADGTTDTTFGVGGISTVVGFAGTKRMALTSDLQGKWWTIISPASGTFAPKISVAGPSGDPTASWTIPNSDLLAMCASAYPTLTPTTWVANNGRVLVRRSSGFWLSYTCTGNNNSSQVTGENLSVMAAYTDAGVRDVAIPVIGMNNAHGSSGQCFFNNFIADPTAPVTAPEMYVLRTETTLVSNGNCTANTSGLTAANTTGYSLLSVASNGTVTGKNIASNGDATDGNLSGRIDPGGRIVAFNSNLANTSTMSIRRIKTDGTLDTTIGTGGVLSLPIGAAPAGQNSVRANAAGIITTPTKVYFSVLITDQTTASTICQNTNSFTWGYRYAVVSPTDGLLNTFGTNGVGARTSITMPENTQCLGSLGGGGSVDTAGVSRYVRFDNGVTKLDKWEAPVGTNGGGDGGTGSGGATSDTGGAPSKGESSTSTSTANVDNTVYTKLPAAITANTAIQVLTAAQAKTQVLTTRTPKVCLTLTTSIVVTGTGTCTVRVLSKADKTTLRTLTSKSSTKATTVGTTITASDPLKFSIVSWKLSAASKAQIAKLAETAKTASRVLVVGHTGMLFENEAANQHISTFRAAAVKAALQKAGVKTPFSVVGMGSRVPLTTTKTESAQAKNRRVVLYFFP